jgi:nicotinamidase-related amidase
VNQLPPKTSALVVIDVQVAFDEWEAAGRKRNNPAAVANISALLSAFRRNRMAIFHIRHASKSPNSAFGFDRPGYAVRAEAREQPGEPVIIKQVNSAFIGTDLEQRLRQRRIRSLVIVGATTNHCVETTTRMAGNMGFDARLVRDATWTFDRTGPDGDLHTADEVHAMSLANLSGEFAEIVTAAAVIKSIGVE